MLLLLCSTVLTIAIVFAEPVTLTVKGKAQITIAIHPQADSLERLAAQELSRYLQSITTVPFSIAQVQPHISTKSKYIWVGTTNHAKQPSSATYYITSKEGNVFISGSSSWNTLEAVYIFLEQYAGCQFLTPQAEKIPHQPNLTVDANYSYSPFISTRTVHSKLYFDNPLFAAKRRVSTVTFPGFVPGAGVHTFHKLVPADVWLQKHPEFFALVNGRRQATQLCLANDTVYRLVVDSVKAWFERNPESNVLSVSQDDNTSYCTCSRCAATDAHEGSSAGSMIHFVNRVAQNFPDKTISTLAYQYTRRAPRHVRPLSNVLITLCSIECDRSAPIADKCKDFERDLQEWKATGATLKIWDYTTQFTNFLAPFPNLHTLQPNVQLFVANNTRWVFEQHSHNPSELFELRSYMLAQLLWNPNASYDSLYHGFMDNYYGAAAGPIKQYIHAVHEAIQTDKKFFLFLYGDPAQAFGSFLRIELLEQYQQWFDAAEAAANNDSTLLHRVRAARIGVDYAMLEYSRRSAGKYSFANQKANRQLLSRFEAATHWLKAVLINEMGLRTEEYIAAYKAQAAIGTSTNLAEGKTVTLLTQPKKYAGENPQALADGMMGGWGFGANWLGFEGNHLEAIIDLGERKSFRQAGIHFLQVSNHLVFFPVKVLFQFSDNGVDFGPPVEVDNQVPLQPNSRVNDIQLYSTPKHTYQARYIKVTGQSMQVCPPWHHGAGLPCWVFADEFLVNE